MGRRGPPDPAVAPRRLLNFRNFACQRMQISSLIRTVPSHRGAARDRHGRGAGCGGRGSARDERGLPRTAKSCGSDAPTPASSLREEAQATVSNKRGHRGEHEARRKTIARGMPGRSGVTVVTMLVCFFHCTRGCGRIARPAFPAPSEFQGTGIQSKPRAQHAARSRSRVCTRRAV